MPGTIQLYDHYGSPATIGTAKVVVNGSHIDVTQTNEVAWAMPMVAGRAQLMLLAIALAAAGCRAAVH